MNINLNLETSRPLKKWSTSSIGNHFFSSLGIEKLRCEETKMTSIKDEDEKETILHACANAGNPGWCGNRTQGMMMIDKTWQNMTKPCFQSSCEHAQNQHIKVILCSGVDMISNKWQDEQLMTSENKTAQGVPWWKCATFHVKIWQPRSPSRGCLTDVTFFLNGCMTKDDQLTQLTNLPQMFMYQLDPDRSGLLQRSKSDLREDATKMQRVETGCSPRLKHAETCCNPKICLRTQQDDITSPSYSKIFSERYECCLVVLVMFFFPSILIWDDLPKLTSIYFKWQNKPPTRMSFASK